MSTTSRSSRWASRTRSQRKAEAKELRQQANEGPVLLALRGRNSSEAPVRIASLIAGKLQRELQVISVVEPAVTYALPPQMPEGSLAVDEESRKARQTVISEMLPRTIEPATPYDFDVQIGMPVQEIRDIASRINAALIVVGSAPRRRGNQTVSGRRAGQILLRSKTPVLSVDPALADLPHTVIVATDFSTASVHAAQIALDILADGGRITLMHVMPTSGSLLPNEPITTVQLREEVIRRLEEIRHFLMSESSSSAHIEIAVTEGDAYQEILAHAERIGADLIATGTHGRAGLGRLIVGSTAADILHGAPCSVLASTEPDVAEAMRIELEMGQQVASREKDKWGEILDEFSRRNEGRDVELEVDDPSLGAQIQATGYKLGGVSYDEDDRVTVMLRSSERGDTHLTRNIPGVESIAVSVTKSGRDGVLELKHGKGHTLVILRN